MSNAQLVAEFHRAVGDAPPGRPQVPGQQLIDLRASLISEEFQEVAHELAVLRERLGDDSRTSAEALAPLAHELADLLYVTYGTLIALGLPANEIFAEVHRANIAKTTGPKRSDGKQLKPVGWQPAAVLAIVRDASKAPGLDT